MLSRVRFDVTRGSQSFQRDDEQLERLRLVYERLGQKARKTDKDN